MGGPRAGHLLTADNDNARQTVQNLIATVTWTSEVYELLNWTQNVRSTVVSQVVQKTSSDIPDLTDSPVNVCVASLTAETAEIAANLRQDQL